MSDIQFGVMLIFNMCLGNITPPVGSVLFVGCGISKLRIEDVTKMLLPYFAVLFPLLFPWLSILRAKSTLVYPASSAQQSITKASKKKLLKLSPRALRDRQFAFAIDSRLALEESRPPSPLSSKAYHLDIPYPLFFCKFFARRLFSRLRWALFLRKSSLRPMTFLASSSLVSFRVLTTNT